jgi:uncharacterized lipoprotein YmbA
MRHLTVLLIATLLAACASAPESLFQLRWQDQRGDRGAQVLQRDLAWCAESVETRRSLLQACIAERGWIARDS